MVPALDFGQFRQRLIREFGCKYSKLEGQPRIRLLERTVNGEVRRRMVRHSDDALLSPGVIQNICAYLGVDQTEFDLPPDYS